MRTLTALVATAAVLAACGGDDSQDGAAGNNDAAAGDPKQVFAATCGGCHTMKDAGTKGTLGPDLDELGPDRQRVLAAIKAGPGSMPANLLEGSQAEAVADYVQTNAGG